MEIDVLYLDFFKVFDFINYVKLFVKLKLYGIFGFFWEWFKDYFSNCKQCVVVDGIKFSFIFVILGVFQGSLLGLFFFVLYVNDFLDVILVGICMVFFVDDIKCYCVQRFLQDYFML